MAILGLASFQRANASANTIWPAGNDGQSWVQASGPTGSWYSVTANEGIITGTASNLVALYGTKTTYDFQLLVRVNIQSSASTAVGVVACSTAGASTYYVARFVSGSLQLRSVIAGTATTLKSAAFTVTPGAHYYYLRFWGTGSSPITLAANAWAEGTIEPTTWVIPAFTDNSITAAGRFGVLVNPASTSEVVSVDSFSACDGNGAPSSISNDCPYAWTYFSEGTSNPPAAVFTDLGTYARAQGGTNGTQWLRFQLPWHFIEVNPANAVTDPPTNTPQYNAQQLSVLDYVVGQCNSLGINLLLPIEDAPTNYRIWNDNGTPAPNSNGQATGVVAAPSGYVRFARFLADRYNGLTGHGIVQAFQMGNEEFDLYQGRTGAALIPMAITMYPALKAIYPGVNVGNGAVRRTPQAGQTHIKTWCNTVFSGIGPCSDWADFHYYRDGSCSPDPNVPCTDSTDVPTAAQEWADIASQLPALYTSRPIYCLETGQQLGAVVGGITITETLRSQYLREMYDAGRNYVLNGGGGAKVGIWTIEFRTNSYSITSSSLPTFTDLQTYMATYPQWTQQQGPPPPPPPTANSASAKMSLAFVYKSDGVTFLDVLRDGPILAGFKEAINAATSSLQIILPRAFDNFDEVGGTGNIGTIGQGNVIKWYVYGPGLPVTGLLRFQGIIDAYAPQISDTGEENLTVTIVPYGSVLSDHGIGGTVTIGVIGGTGQDTVKHFNYWFTTTDSITGKTFMAPYTLDPNNPSTSGNVCSYTYTNETILSIFQTILQMSPSNWYFRTNDRPYNGNNNTTLTVSYNVPPTTAQHVFYVGQHISQINYSQDWTNLKNVIYLTGATTYISGSSGQPSTPSVITAIETGSDLAHFGERLLLYNDSRITDQNTATILAEGLLLANDLVTTNATLRVLDYRGDNNPGLGYDIETITVGDTCQVLDASLPVIGGQALWDQAQWDVNFWDYQPGQELNQVTIIAGLTYGFDYVDLELQTMQPSQDFDLLKIRNHFQDFTMGYSQ